MSRAHDFYTTPRYPVHRLLDVVGGDLAVHLDWLDPCAGQGHLIRAVQSWYDVERPKAPAADPAHWRAYELQEQFKPCLEHHAQELVVGGSSLVLDWDCGGISSVVIMNPPFKIAYEFVYKAVTETGSAGSVFVLLPLNFMTTEKRTGFLRVHTPSIYVLPNRPSFTGNGRTMRGVDYAWFGWGERSPRVVILGNTPAAERKADHDELAGRSRRRQDGLAV